MGFQNETEVHVNATGKGFLQFTGQDVVFAIDSSGSMAWNDPDPDGIPCNANLPQRIVAAWNYVDNLTGEDMGAYVDFDTVATLRVPLWMGTSFDNYMYLKQDPTNGLWCSDQSGGTTISESLIVANQHLVNTGIPNHVKVIILLTDAEQIVPQDHFMSMMEADFAAANDITIFTIGLNIPPNSGPPGGEDLLTYIAKTTGGQYFQAPSASTLAGIFTQIMSKVRSIAGYNPTPGVGSPMTTYVLDQGIEFVPNSFTLEPGTIETDPNPDTVHASLQESTFR
jgi:hypothetical protein